MTGSSRDRFAKALGIVEDLEDRGLTGSEAQGAIEDCCAGDLGLLEEVRALLGRAPSTFLSRLPIEVPWATEGGLAGRVLGDRYELEDLIGSGSMGIVYRGRDLELGRAVAIKMIRGVMDPGGREGRRMLKEARVAAGVRHPNVVEVHDVGIDEGVPYMVMDWLPGVDLGRWLAEVSSGRREKTGQDLAAFLQSELDEPVRPAWADRPYAEIVARLGVELARACQAAHDEGVVHRDLAPKNVLLDGDCRPMLVDFGLAAWTDPSEASSTRAGAAGTLPFMAPESLTDLAAARLPAVDVYGLGATLYHLLAGRAPFPTDLEGGLIHRVLTDLPPGLATLDPDLSPDLVAIVFAAMEKRPEERYGSARDLAEDLEAFLERRPVSRRPPGPVGRMRRWAQRRPVHAIAAGLGIVTLLTSGLFGAELWKEHGKLREQRRVTEFADRFARLPALLTLESNASLPGPPLRVPAEAGAGALLAELVELEPGEPLLGWYLANWASQHGDLELARSELERLAAAGHATPRFEALAAALLDPDPETRNRLLDPADLPQARPGSAFDHALLGHLACRWRRFDLAWSELTQALQLEPDRWLYRDLRIVPGMGIGRGEVSVDDAWGVERELGRTTPRALHARALVAQESDRPVLARDLWAQLLDLVPRQHQALHGIGRSWSLEQDLGRAEEYLERAIEAKYGSWNSFLLLARCAQEQGHFEEALAVLERGRGELPPAMDPSAAFQHLDLNLESIDVVLAWAAKRERLGEDATDLYRAAAELVERIGTPEALRLTGVAAEVESLDVALDVKLGRIELESAVLRQRELLVDFLAEYGGVSPVIATNLGMHLLESGEAERLEARIWLAFDPRMATSNSRVGLAIADADEPDPDSDTSPAASAR